MRASGILMPIFSLPSRYGIGSFSKSAYQFVDMLKKAGQKYWQILPLCPTSYGDSPYQSFSTYAGNPYFIDLETLVAKGLLTKAECDAADLGADPQDIDYEKQYFHRFPLLKKAFGARKKQQQEKGRSEKKLQEFFADALFNIRISGCLLKMVQQPFIITAFQTAGIKSKPGKQFCLIGTDHTALAVYNDLFFCLKFVFSLNQLICRNIEGIF